MPRLVVAILCLTLLSAAPAQTGPVQVLENWVDYNFGDQITFNVRIQSQIPIEAAIIFFQAQGDTHTNIGTPTYEVQEDGSYLLSYTHPLSSYSLPAFAEIEYRFEIRFEGDEQAHATKTYSFSYQDNRFVWQTLQEGPFQVHWFEGDLLFAQSILDTAQIGMQNAQKLLSLPELNSLEIYVYPDGRTMQAALQPSSSEWVAGHADPTLGVVVVALPEGPEQRLLVEQRIPHEILHIMLYHAANLGYANLPTWLNEGLASSVEIYPNPDYRILLEDAVEKDSLLPMSSLCQAFPRQVSSALLSYAQSASFVHYLYRSYGSSGLDKLVTAYVNGLDCQRGAQVALGKNLSRLEREWQRDELSQNVALTAFNNLLPWLVMLGLAVAAPLALLVRRFSRRGLQQPVRQSSG